eukprot:TRINITY_DN16196_c0_g1_i2.p1 TRINITY_DN16196_c0_g1~~TRINITY_DN16196_c0_g1_i2.p1  ORF type:complete len:166 (-),score=24.95 TRINITY_DN16196_c0_g1_i2:714-1211(-)
MVRDITFFMQLLSSFWDSIYLNHLMVPNSLKRVFYHIKCISPCWPKKQEEMYACLGNLMLSQFFCRVLCCPNLYGLGEFPSGNVQQVLSNHFAKVFFCLCYGLRFSSHQLFHLNHWLDRKAPCLRIYLDNISVISYLQPSTSDLQPPTPWPNPQTTGTVGLYLSP